MMQRICFVCFWGFSNICVCGVCVCVSALCTRYKYSVSNSSLLLALFLSAFPPDFTFTFNSFTFALLHLLHHPKSIDFEIITTSGTNNTQSSAVFRTYKFCVFYFYFYCDRMHLAQCAAPYAISKKNKKTIIIPHICDKLAFFDEFQLPPH